MFRGPQRPLPGKDNRLGPGEARALATCPRLHPDDKRPDNRHPDDTHNRVSADGGHSRALAQAFRNCTACQRLPQASHSIQYVYKNPCWHVVIPMVYSRPASRPHFGQTRNTQTPPPVGIAK